MHRTRVSRVSHRVNRVERLNLASSLDAQFRKDGRVTPSCAFSLPSFSRRVASSEISQRLFFYVSCWLGFWLDAPIPAWIVLLSDGGHAAVAGCAPLLRPLVADWRHISAALRQGILRSFELPWLRVSQERAVQICPILATLGRFVGKLRPVASAAGGV